MSASSYHMAFFTEKPLPDWRGALLEAWKMLDGVEIFLAHKSVGESREWEEMHCDQDEVDALHNIQPVEGGRIFRVGPDPTTYSLPTALPQIIEAEVSPEEYVYLDVHARWPERVLLPALERTIAPSALGEYAPTCVHLRVGPHDVFEWRDGEEDGTCFGRATLSIVVYDKRVPRDPDTVGREILGVPAAAAFAGRFAARFGEVKTAWFWGWET